MTVIAEERYRIFKGMAQNNEAFSCVPTRFNLEIHNVRLTDRGYLINPENTSQELNPRIISLDVLPESIRDIFKTEQSKIGQDLKDRAKLELAKIEEAKEETKICNICEEEKLLSHFGRIGKGYRKACNSCFATPKKAKKILKKPKKHIEKKAVEKQMPEKKENFKMVDINYIKEKIQEAYQNGYRDGKAAAAKEVYYPSLDELLENTPNDPKHEKYSEGELLGLVTEYGTAILHDI